MFLVLVCESDALAVTGFSVLTYSLASCPAGWNNMEANALYAGRTIKGTSTNAGTTVGTAMTTAEYPQHYHRTTLSFETTFPASPRSFDAVVEGSSPPYFNLALNYLHLWYYGEYLDEEESTRPYPIIHLNLCKSDQSSSFYLPPGMVFFAPNENPSCPSGTTMLAQSDGRLLVFGSSAADVSSPKVSPAGPVGSGAEIGRHTHPMPATITGQLANSQNVYTTSSDTSCTSGTLVPAVRPANGILNFNVVNTGESIPLGVPYVQLSACEVLNSGSGILGTEHPRPHRNLIFYYANQACPEDWEDSTTRTDSPDSVNAPYANLVGRVVINRPVQVNSAFAGRIYGNPQPFTSASNTAWSGANHPSHSHTYSDTWGNRGTFISGQYTCVNPNDFISLSSITHLFSSGVESTSAGNLIPYRVMRGCSPIATSAPSKSPSKSPSRSPSRTPTTSAPSKSPSRAPTTSSPSASPVVLACRPSHGMNKVTCEKKIKSCKIQNVLMKWSGVGCRIKGKAAGDGGCQCVGYCGYKCRAACNADKTCLWVPTLGGCVVKSTRVKGGQMQQCIASPAGR